MTFGTRYCLLVLILFFFAPNVFGQGGRKSIDLKIVLDSITLLHNVKFNYSEHDITNYNVIPPVAAMPLKAKLTYLANRTSLNFKETGNYIVVFIAPKIKTNRICAYVTDELGMPLDNAIVQYDNANKLVTGDDGYFELPQQHQALYVARLGYADKFVSLNDFKDDCLQIILSLETNELTEVVAERYLATGISKQKDGSYTIKPRKFGILPGLVEPDVLQAMQQLPGINSTDETVSNINVRGGTHDQNLFTWNGIRLFQTGHFFGLISAISPNLAHDIKIYKNGTSAFYGESVSSAVDISSHPLDIGNNTASIGTNMISADFYTRIKTSDNSTFEVSARRSFTDVIDLPTYSNYSKRIFQNTIVTELTNSTDINYKSDKEFYFYDFTAQYHQKIGSKHNLYLDAIGINNKLDFTQGTFSTTAPVTTTSILEQLTLGATALWKTQWNDEHSSEVSIYKSYYDVDGASASLNTNQVTTQNNTVNDAGIRVSDHQKITEMFSLHTGYQYNKIDIKNSDETNELNYIRQATAALRSHAVITEVEYNPESSKVYIRAGLRGNYIEQFSKLYAEPRLQVNYSIKPGWQLEVLAERKSQTASQVVELQDDFLGIEKRRWILADNNEIPLQRSSQVSGGITFKKSGWLLAADNFYKKVTGITTGGQAFQNQFELQSSKGSYTVYGTEFLVQKQFKNFYAWLSYTWNNNNYRFDDVEPRKFPSNFELAHTINSALNYEWNNLKIALGSKWYTGKPVTEPLISEPTSGGSAPTIAYAYPNSRNLDNFFQANFSAAYSASVTSKARLQFGLSVLNVFNRKNIINNYYRVNTTTNDIEAVNTFALKRTPNAFIKLSL